MSEAGALYRAEIVHRRFVPVAHELRYDATYLLLDVDRLDETARGLRLLGRERGGLFKVRDRDFGPDGKGTLPERLRALLREHGLAAGVERISMLCLPRSLGYVFNPMTTYYGHAADGGLSVMVYEVSNTFGERRHYVLPVGDEAGPSRRQACSKSLYVSPFNEADGHYDFTFMVPDDRLRLTVSLSRQGERILSAYVAGARRPLTDREILRAFLARPFLTYGVIAGIHWEALKLWRKGLRLRPRPAAHAPAVPTAAKEPGR